MPYFSVRCSLVREYEIEADDASDAMSKAESMFDDDAFMGPDMDCIEVNSIDDSDY